MSTQLTLDGQVVPVRRCGCRRDRHGGLALCAEGSRLLRASYRATVAMFANETPETIRAQAEASEAFDAHVPLDLEPQR